MSYQIEETGELGRRAQVEVPVERFKRSYTGALKQLSKRVRLPGFRKGKIPMSVMKRNYGPNVMQDVIEELLREQIDQIVAKAERVVYLGQPNVTQMPDEKRAMRFDVEYELRPKLDPVGYLGLEVERPAVEIEEEEIDERLEQLRERHGVLEPIEGRDTIEPGDTVTLDFEALGEGEPALEEMKGEGVTIKVGEGQALPGIEEALVGAKFDATLTTSLTLEEDFPVESLKGEEVELKIAVKEVKRSALPELDDDFAKEAGLGETLKEGRGKLKQELEAQRAHEARHLAEDNLVDALIEATPFELPPHFVEEQIDRSLSMEFQRMTGQRIDPQVMRGEQFGPMREQAGEQVRRQVKSEFLLMAIAEKEGLKVDDEDLRAYCAHQSQHMQGVDAVTFERYVRQDQQRLQQAAASALLEKTLTHLLGEASLIDVPWPSGEDQAEETTEETTEETPKAKKAAAKKAAAKKAPAAKKPTEKKAAAKKPAAAKKAAAKKQESGDSEQE